MLILSDNSFFLWNDTIYALVSFDQESDKFTYIRGFFTGKANRRCIKDSIERLLCWT